jgi:PTS system nitrogen regulatory IIA component
VRAGQVRDCCGLPSGTGRYRRIGSAASRELRHTGCRHRVVVESLPATAERGQTHLQSCLEQARTSGPVSGYRFYWIEKAAGFSVTAVGSGQIGKEGRPGEITQEDEIPAAESAMTAEGSRLSRMLRPSGIRIWQKPVTRDEVIRDLAAVVCQSHHGLQPREIESALQMREREITTFLNEGIAVPHACVESLSEIMLAFGVTKQGVTDAPVSKPIEAVFMALYPGRLSAGYLKLMSTALTALRGPPGSSGSGGRNRFQTSAGGSSRMGARPTMIPVHCSMLFSRAICPSTHSPSAHDTEQAPADISVNRSLSCGDGGNRTRDSYYSQGH